MTEELLIPASYDVWLTNLKQHLDRFPGSKAALARYLSTRLGLRQASAHVKLSRIVNDHRKPEIEVFFDIAVWLQQQQDGAR